MGFRSAISTTNQSFCGIKDPNIYHYKLAFNKGAVVLKPHALIGEDGEITPYIVGDGGNTALDFGDWIRAYDIVRIATGASGVRFCVKETESLARNPVLTLKNAIEAAIAGGIAPPSWRTILPERDNNSQMSSENFRKVCMIYEPGCGLFLATIISIQGMPYQHARNLTLVQITKATGAALFQALINAGQLPDLDDPRAAIAIVPVTARREGMAIVPNHYEVSVVVNPQWLDAALYQGHKSYITNNNLGWSKFLSILSEKEQINYILSSSIPASAVVYALQEYKELIPASYWEMGKKMLDREINMISKTNEPEVVQPEHQFNQPRYQHPFVQQQDVPQYGISGQPTQVGGIQYGQSNVGSPVNPVQNPQEGFFEGLTGKPQPAQPVDSSSNLPEALTPEQVQEQIQKFLMNRGRK